MLIVLLALLFAILGLNFIALFNYAKEMRRRMRAEMFLGEITMDRAGHIEVREAWINVAREWLAEQEGSKHD